MTLKKVPFVRYNEDKVRDSFTVNLNVDERAILEKAKRLIQQSKDSTALKFLAILGAKYILSDNVGFLLAGVFDHKRKNARLGIVDFEDVIYSNESKN